MNNIIDSEGIINVIVNVGFIATFISIFFFTYASGVEQEIVKSQAQIMMNDLFQTITPLLNDDAKEKIMNYEVSDMSKEDADALDNNNKLINSGYSILIIVFIVTQVVGLALSIYFKHNYNHIIIGNVIVLIFVGLTEYTFLNVIGRSYMSVDTNFIRWKILTSIREKLIYKDNSDIEKNKTWNS
jgi:hypothetical protein